MGFDTPGIWAGILVLPFLAGAAFWSPHALVQNDCRPQLAPGLLRALKRWHEPQVGGCEGKTCRFLHPYQYAPFHPPACTGAADGVGSGEGAELALAQPRRAQLQASSLGPSQWSPFREKLRVGGACHCIAQRWDLNHIV